MESIARTPGGSVDQGCSLTDPMSSLVWSLAPIKYPVIRHTGARAGGATVRGRINPLPSATRFAGFGD
jgi:hypothetical protein